MAYALGPYAILGTAGFFSLCGLRKPILKPSALCIGAALALFAYGFGRAFFSPYPYFARPDLTLSLACLVVYLLTSLYLTQARFRTGVALLLCLMATLHVLIGGIQFVEGDNFLLYGFTRPAIYASQASGLFINPHYFATLMTAVGLFAAGYAIWGRYALSAKISIGYILLVCMGGVAISGCKPGYLGLFFGLALFAAISVWVVGIYRPPQFPLAMIGAAVAVAFLCGTTALMMKRSTVLSDRLAGMSQVSKDVRRYHWSAAVDHIKVAPVFGTGAGTRTIYQRYFRRTPVQTDVRDAHCDYLDFISEYGAVGGALAAAFLLVHFMAGFRNIREIAKSRLMNVFGPPKTNSMALMTGAFAAAATVLFQSLFESNLRAPVNALVLAFAFGILSNSGINRETEEQRPGPLDLGFRRALGLAGLVLLVLSLHWYRAEKVSNLARRAFEVQQYQEATLLSARAIAADPANPLNYFYRAETLREMAETLPAAQRQELYTQAAGYFREGIARSPEDELFWIRLGQTLDTLGEFESAGEAYVRALSSDPNLGLIYAYYAEHLRLAGDIFGAQECAETARKLTGRVRKLTDLEDPLPLLNVGAPLLKGL